MRSLIDLVEILVDATEARKLSWSVADDVCSASISEKYTVSIWEWTDDDSGIHGISAKLSKSGIVVDKVVSDEYSKNFAALSNLYSVAMRSANNVNEMIDEIEGIIKRGRAKKGWI